MLVAELTFRDSAKLTQVAGAVVVLAAGEEAHSDQAEVVVLAAAGVEDHSAQWEVVVVLAAAGVVVHSAHCEVVVVVVTSGTGAHGFSLATAEAVAAPTMAAVAMKDFILSFGVVVGSRKSD